MSNVSLAFSAVSDPDIKGLPSTINGVAYTGALIKNHGELGNVVVDLDTIKIPEKLLLLSDHDRTIRPAVPGLLKRSFQSMYYER